MLSHRGQDGHRVPGTRGVGRPTMGEEILDAHLRVFIGPEILRNKHLLNFYIRYTLHVTSIRLPRDDIDLLFLEALLLTYHTYIRSKYPALRWSPGFILCMKDTSRMGLDVTCWQGYIYYILVHREISARIKHGYSVDCNSTLLEEHFKNVSL